MADSFTEVSSESWFSRLGGAFKNILFGIVLFLLSFVVLWWNEGRAVKTAKIIAEGEKSAISVPADKVDAANEGKLIHLTGEATTSEELKDDLFQVSSTGIALHRQVEMYQWIEKEEKKREKELGGSEKTTTVYTYTKDWDARVHDSSQFKVPADHTNPKALPFPSQAEWAKTVKVGAFQLSDELIKQISGAQPLTLTAAHLAALPQQIKDKVKLAAGQFF